MDTTNANNAGTACDPTGALARREAYLARRFAAHRLMGVSNLESLTIAVAEAARVDFDA